MKLILNLLGIFAFIICVSITYYSGYNNGYSHGKDVGYAIALDTVNSICNSQLKDSNIVTKLMLNAYRDTNIYYLSHRQENIIKH